MRYLITFFLLLLPLQADEVNWNSDFAAAKAKAQKEDKIIYAVITSETCRWCRKLEATTLQDPKIIESLNEKYAAVAITRGEGTYPQCFKAKMVPMTYFAAPDGRIIYSVPGYWQEEDYLSMMGDVERKYDKQKRAALLSNQTKEGK